MVRIANKFSFGKRNGLNRRVSWLGRHISEDDHSSDLRRKDTNEDHINQVFR